MRRLQLKKKKEGKMTRILSLLVLSIGVVAIIVGGVFIGLGASRDMQLKEAMRTEQVKLGIESELGDEVIDSLPEAMKAGDTIREHRRGIAASYEELLGEGRYDPTNPQHLTYAQAMNLENYLYLAVVAFGLTQAVMASGVFMVLTGIALGSTGLVLYQLR
jgi:hypothetical protein